MGAAETQDRRLTRTVRADEGPALAGADGPVDIGQDRAPLTDEVDRFEPQDIGSSHEANLPEGS